MVPPPAYPKTLDSDLGAVKHKRLLAREGRLLQDPRHGTHVRGSGLQRLANAVGQHYHGNLRAERLLVSAFS